MECIGEINPEKFGRLTPGTLIPILAEEDVLRSNPDYMIVLPWHFRQFFEQEPKYAGRCLVFPLPSLDVLEKAVQ
jgi:NDP-4-keto-2,6-dideoxyhexose 3-C-methyltransferase